MTDDPLHDDARTAFLFQCGECDLFAVSLDKTGANIPMVACINGWRCRDEFRLGVHEAMPIAISPEPILRGIKADGYFIWRKGSIYGTSQ
jgi:hypothetical protein